MKIDRKTPLFDKEEIEAIRIYLGELPAIELKCMILRFWGRYTIAEIARDIRKSWDETDRIIDRAVDTLRVACVRDRAFFLNVIGAQAA